MTRASGNCGLGKAIALSAIAVGATPPMARDDQSGLRYRITNIFFNRGHT